MRGVITMIVDYLELREQLSCSVMQKSLRLMMDRHSAQLQSCGCGYHDYWCSDLEVF